MSLLFLTAVVLCIAASIDADGFTLSVGRIESARSKLIRTGKWADYQDRKSSVRSTRLASRSQPLIEYEDGEYIANVSIGTPPQAFLVLLSLRTGALWVPDTTCPSKDCPSYCSDAVYCQSLCVPRCCNARKLVAELAPSNSKKFGDCGWRNRFDSRKSSSYRKNGTHFTDVFSADANADGFIGLDTVTLGNGNDLKVASQTFGQATSADFLAVDAFDGVLGLGSEMFNMRGLVLLLHNAKMQNVVPSNIVTVALMLQDVKTMYLPGGTITYGGLDKNYCDPDVIYVQPSSNDPSYLPMDGVSFGSFQVTNANWTAQPGFDATALTGPSDVIDAFAKVAGAVKDQHNIYHIACNATVPSLFISIGGNSFLIPPEELLLRPFGATIPDCVFNVRGGQDLFSIGAALARGYCLIFDYDSVKFGFSLNYYGLDKG